MVKPKGGEEKRRRGGGYLSSAHLMAQCASNGTEMLHKLHMMREGGS